MSRTWDLEKQQQNAAKALPFYLLLIFISQGKIFRVRSIVKKWGTIGKEVKGGVHRLMDILRGLAFSREAAVSLTEDTWTLSLWSHPGGLCYGGKSSLSTERQSCPLAGLLLHSWGLCLCSMRLWWKCPASFHIWVILERMILEVKEVCFHWCHLVHPLMPWYLHCLIGDCTDSVIANCVLGWLLASLGHWQSGTISVQPLERAVETCLWHTRLFWAARPLVSNEGIRLDQFLLPFLLHRCWGLLCISSS